MSIAVTAEGLTKCFTYRKRGHGLRGLVKSTFRPDHTIVPALIDLSFKIEVGERVAIIGLNGAGKTTTLKLLTGVLSPSAGTVRVLGLTPWKQRVQLAPRMGALFGQRSQLWSDLPARESFAVLRLVYDQNAAIFGRRLDSLIDQFSLGLFIDQPVNRLSMGQRMRCEIVARLLHEPAILFFDEPTIGLDVNSKAVIRDSIVCRAQQLHQTLILTSHDPRDIECMCDRVIVLSAGRLVLDEGTATLRRDLLPRKYVSITSRRGPITLRLPGVTQRSADRITTVFEVDTRQCDIKRVVTAALAIGEIDDLSIEDPPMEDVIREIFATFSYKDGR